MTLYAHAADVRIVASQPRYAQVADRKKAVALQGCAYSLVTALDPSNFP